MVCINHNFYVKNHVDDACAMKEHCCVEIETKLMFRFNLNNY